MNFWVMDDPYDDAAAYQQELETRRFLEEAQETLKADAEAYERWLDWISRQERTDA